MDEAEGGFDERNQEIERRPAIDDRGDADEHLHRRTHESLAKPRGDLAHEDGCGQGERDRQKEGERGDQQRPADKDRGTDRPPAEGAVDGGESARKKEFHEAVLIDGEGGKPFDEEESGDGQDEGNNQKSGAGCGCGSCRSLIPLCPSPLNLRVVFIAMHY